MSTLDSRPPEIAPTRGAVAVDPRPAFVGAWRQLHHAAQIASEVGKAWAPPQGDDSHSSFEWRDGSLLGVAIPAPRPFRAALRVRDLELWLVALDGASLASLSLVGETLASGFAWVREQAERLAGEGPRQPARPAPDLPPHPVADGAAFGGSEAAAFPGLARLLAEADSRLRRIERDVPGASAVRCWPHHFDLATLVSLEAPPVRTIGVGLAAPDALEPSGYWYVSPWSERPPIAPPAASPLPCGRWIDRGGALPMAALPLAELAGLGAPPRRAARDAFLDAAFAAAQAALGGSRRRPPPGPGAS